MTVPLILPNRYTDPMKKFISSTLGLLVVLACLMAYSTSAQAGTKNRPRSAAVHRLSRPDRVRRWCRYHAWQRGFVLA